MQDFIIVKIITWWITPVSLHGDQGYFKKYFNLSYLKKVAFLFFQKLPTYECYFFCRLRNKSEVGNGISMY